MLSRAIACFESQSYRDKELVIVSDGLGYSMGGIIKRFDSRVRIIAVPNDGNSLGQLRNFAIQQAEGTYVMQWDDDDWYHPDRIKIQVEALEAIRADICCLERWTMAWPARNRYVISKRREWQGSMLAVKERLPSYANLRRGEYTVLMDTCRRAGLKIHLLDRPDLYVYVVHGQNTYPEEHFEKHIFNEISGVLSASEAAELDKRLAIPMVLEQPVLAGRVRPYLGRRASIAVVIPCYGQKHFLSRALGSVLWQLEPNDEVIVVNDCGEDWRPGEVVGPEPDRVMWLHHDTRRGVAASRNTAIRRAKAEWIQFLDADDVLAPFALDALRRANDLPESIHVLAGGCHRIVDGGYRDYLADSEQSLGRILDANPLLPSAVFVRRSALMDVGLFDERIDFEEDWDLWLRLHERYGLEAFAVVDRPVCYYWITEAERREKVRTGTVDGLPVREYFRQRYGANPA